MRKSLAVLVVFLILASPVLAQTSVDYFYGIGCPHCKNVEDSGVLEKIGSEFNVTKYEVYYNVAGQNKFAEDLKFVGLKFEQGKVPFAFINCSGKYSYLVGDSPIINNLSNYLKTNCAQQIEHNESGLSKLRYSIQEKFNKNFNSQTGKLSFFGILILVSAAAIDSVNPCAFGVLIFLMISLLAVGSSRRAVRYGLIYSATVFVSYFLAGLGIMKVIQSLSFIRQFIYIAIGAFVLVFGILELVDFLRTTKGKTAILKIPTGTKPFLEKIIRKGTLPAMIVLGFLVSAVELPCTGGIYLAILSLIARNNLISILYLLLYNFIFVLPMILLTLAIGKGISAERMHSWTNSEKKWMKLSAGILLIILAVVIFSVG
jgi:cytochrome c biogenesis protein CcdA